MASDSPTGFAHQRISRFLYFLTFVAAVACCTGVTRAQELAAREFAPSSTFSIQPPKGWDVGRNATRGVLVAVTQDGASLQARETAHVGTLQSLADRTMDSAGKRFADFKLLSSTEVQSSSGLKGLELVFEHRLVATGPIMRQSLFFYEARPGFKLFITCVATPDAYTPELQELFRKVAATIQVENPPAQQ